MNIMMAAAKGLFVIYQLLGQQPLEEHGLATDGLYWHQPGGIYSSALHAFPFDQMCPILNASVHVQGWWEPQAEVNFFWIDAFGPSGYVGFQNINMEEASHGTDPLNAPRDVTAIFQQLQQEGIPKQIGYEVHGKMVLTSIKIYVIYDIKHCE